MHGDPSDPSICGGFDNLHGRCPQHEDTRVQGNAHAMAMWVQEREHDYLPMPAANEGKLQGQRQGRLSGRGNPS